MLKRNAKKNKWLIEISMLNFHRNPVWPGNICIKSSVNSANIARNRFNSNRIHSCHAFWFFNWADLTINSIKYIRSHRRHWNWIAFVQRAWKSSRVTNASTTNTVCMVLSCIWAWHDDLAITRHTHERSTVTNSSSSSSSKMWNINAKVMIAANWNSNKSTLKKIPKWQTAFGTIATMNRLMSSQKKISKHESIGKLPMTHRTYCFMCAMIIWPIIKHSWVRELNTCNRIYSSKLNISKFMNRTCLIYATCIRITSSKK